MDLIYGIEHQVDILSKTKNKKNQVDKTNFFFCTLEEFGNASIYRKTN